MKLLGIILLTLMLLSGCKPVRVKKDFANLQQKTIEQTGHPTYWKDIDKKRIPTPLKTKPTLEVPSPVCVLSFSRQQAIGYALENNYELQAAFEDLGIAKSDLIQAGLFTNPEAECLVKFPKFDLFPFEEGLVNRHTKIDLEVFMQLADFWQVPIRKKVAHNDLEIMTFTILHLIIEISIHTKFAYDTCVYMQKRLELLENILEKLIELQKRIYYRQEFGLERDLDRYMIDIRVAKWQTMIIQQQADLRAAFANLRNVMGLTITTESLDLCDNELIYDLLAVPSINSLEDLGLQYRPQLQIKQVKIAKSEHELSLQRRKVFDNVRFGLAYERDLIEGQGIGPALTMQMPFFDPNYAQIARAQFELKKSKKALKAEKRHMLDQIYNNFEHLVGLQEQLDIYKTSIIQSSKSAIDYSDTFFNRMQLNMTFLLESQITWYEIQEAILTKKFEMAKMYAQLEKTIGKIIS